MQVVKHKIAKVRRKQLDNHYQFLTPILGKVPVLIG
jgi:hypothetical protein